jgi:type IV pilus assembly protein PilC
MPTFSATYTSASGQTRRLQLQSADLTAARRSLRQRGIVPTTLEEVSGEASSQGKGSEGLQGLLNADLGRLFETGPSVRERALFANKLAALINAGVPIVRSLSLMGAQQNQPLLKRALLAVSADVSQGETLGASMRRWPKVFDQLTVAMVEAGEAGGVLDETLQRLARVQEGNAKLQNQLQGALSYPVTVLVITILVFLGMTIFIIPTFAGIFNNLGASLPPLTQALVDLSALLRSPFILLVAVALALLVMLYLRYYESPAGRRRVDRTILRLPVLGDLITKTATARFCRTFSSLIRAGVPILIALDIGQETVGNAILCQAIAGSRSAIQEGIPLSIALSRQRVFPELAMSMLGIGEETGNLDSMLGKVADFYEDEVEAGVKMLTTALEPLLIVCVGGIVGTILVAMYMPMFSVFEQIR